MRESSRRLSVEDAAAHVGRSKATIYRRIQSGRLPAVADGPKFFVDVVELERAFEPRAVEPSVDVEVDTLALSDPVREWALAQAAAAPPMNARQARTVVAILRRAAKAGATG